MRGGGFILAAAALLALSACEIKDTSGGSSGEPSAGAAGPPPMPQPVTLADRPEAEAGERLYVEHCIMCHGDVGMGTGLLARRLQVPLLEARGDLTADYVIQAARMGIGNMPQIPRGEVSDEELEQIADYLAAGPHPAGQMPAAAPAEGEAQ